MHRPPRSVSRRNGRRIGATNLAEQSGQGRAVRGTVRVAPWLPSLGSVGSRRTRRRSPGPCAHARPAGGAGGSGKVRNLECAGAGSRQGIFDYHVGSVLRLVSGASCRSTQFRRRHEARRRLGPRAFPARGMQLRSTVAVFADRYRGGIWEPPSLDPTPDTSGRITPAHPCLHARPRAEPASARANALTRPAPRCVGTDRARVERDAPSR